MELAYDPTTCDLCGGSDARVVVDLRTGRAMRSDGREVARELRKLACTTCGLVRSGTPFAPGELAALYAGDYQVGVRPDHVFHLPGGPLSRSVAFRDWIIDLVGRAAIADGGSLLEVGAGAGHLLDAFASALPELQLRGVEPGTEAAAASRARGLDVATGDLSTVGGTAGTVAAIAVLEHVPSPRALLVAMRAHLAPDGLLVLVQPVQDVPSTDMLFVDHLHHFASGHVAAYAAQLGMRQVAQAVGHPAMPNFSAHAWRRVDPAGAIDALDSAPAWEGPPLETRSADSVASVLAAAARLDALLLQLAADGATVGAFGMGETHWLLRCTSSLADAQLACGIVDDPAAAAAWGLPLQARTPEQAAADGVTDAVLCVNDVWTEQATRRLAAVGIRAHAVWQPPIPGTPHTPAATQGE